MKSTLIKLVASDLDETLLDQGKLSDYSKAVLHRLLLKKIAFVPITARCYDEVDPWLKEQPNIRYCGCSNGAVIVDNKTGKVVVSNELVSKEIVSVLEAVSPINPWWTLVMNNQLYSSKAILKNSAYLKIEDQECQYLKDTRIFVEDYHELLQKNCKVSKLHFITRDSKDKKRLKAKLEVFSDQFNITSSHLKNIELNHLQASKGDAVRWLMDQMHLSAEEVLVFGDNDNDISMFLVASQRVAISSGTDKLLAIATDHCDPACEDGVAKYIETYLLEA